ncbi:hypothetical protein SAMN05216359_11147 [Roseateles sp. YR242]|nr:hypothetical protein SAMN05216359_11147 [Roseateles sp. YR242]
MPPADPTWLHYRPDKENPRLPFAEFMKTTAFKDIQQQFLGNVDRCELFAAQHFSRDEADAIREGFAAFRYKLMEEDGLSWIGIDCLPVLYGIGKQSFDSFCMLLHHPAIELNVRKTALRELASQVKTCMSTGPAFIHALMQVQRPDGTLRGQYWQVLQELMDEVVRKFVRTVWEDRKGDDIELMETHLVNRFRLELRLPGALPKDVVSEALNLVSPEEVRECAELLLRDCRPATVALALAGRYRERLLDRTAELLGTASSQIDLADQTHMSRLLAAARELAPTFQGTSLNSLIKEDVDNGTFCWRADDSLVAYDLLQELEKQGLIQRPELGTLLLSESSNTPWALRHVDRRLVYLQEYFPSAGETGMLEGVRVEHLLLAKPQRDEAAYRRLVDTVLEAESPQALMRFPIEALGSAEQAGHLLRRLGPDRSKNWLDLQRLQEDVIGHLLTAATQDGHAAIVQAIFKRQSGRNPMWFLAQCGGPSILPQAFSSGSGDTFVAWAEMSRRAVSVMPASTLKVLLEDARGNSLVSQVLMKSDVLALSALLDLIEQGQACGKFKGHEYAGLLLAPIQEAMAEGRVEHLKVLGAHALQGASRNWLTALTLQPLLEGPNLWQGCLGAVNGQSVEAVRWFKSVVIQAGEARYLTPLQAGMLLCGKPTSISAQAVAAGVGDHAVLAEVLDGVVKAAHRGWVTPKQVEQALCLKDSNQLSGLASIMLQVGESCAEVWTDTVIALHVDRLLTPDHVVLLLASPSATDPEWERMTPGLIGAPLPHFLCWLADEEAEAATAQGAIYLAPEHRMDHWGNALIRLFKAGCLESAQVVDLLAGWNRGEPALPVAMRRGKLTTMAALMRTYARFRSQDLIDEPRLVGLLQVLPKSPAGTQAQPRVPLEAVSDYVSAVVQMAVEGLLSERASVSLITPYLSEEFDAGDLAARERAVKMVENAVRSKVENAPVRRNSR